MASASTTVVLPEPVCPTRTTLRIPSGRDASRTLPAELLRAAVLAFSAMSLHFPESTRAVASSFPPARGCVTRSGDPHPIRGESAPRTRRTTGRRRIRPVATTWLGFGSAAESGEDRTPRLARRARLGAMRQLRRDLAAVMRHRLREQAAGAVGGAHQRSGHHAGEAEFGCDEGM